MQYEALLAVVAHKKDWLIVLPTGFTKSPIYQLLPFTLNYLITFCFLNIKISRILIKREWVIIKEPIKG